MLSRGLYEKGLYLAFMTIASCLGFSKLLVYSKLISVSEFGIYSLVISSYIFFVFFGGMGLPEGLLKKGSESYAVGNIKAIKAYFLASLVFSIPISGSVAIVLTIAIKFFFPINYEIIDILSVAIVMALATILFNLLDAFLRAQQRFLLFAIALTLKNTLAISLGYVWAIEYGVKGLLVAEIIGLLVTFLVMLFFLLSVQDLKLYKEASSCGLISNGYKLILTLVLRNIAQFIDRWFIAGTLGVIALGYYSFSMVLITTAMVLVGFLVAVQGPKWIADFQIHKSVHYLIMDVNKNILKFAACLILVAPFYLLNIENVLVSFNPEYSEAVVIKLMGIFYLTIFVIVPIYLYDWVFVATSEEGYLVKTNLLAVAVSVFLYAGLWYTNSDIINFALAFLFTRVLTLLLYLKRMRSMYVFQSNQI